MNRGGRIGMAYMLMLISSQEVTKNSKTEMTAKVQESKIIITHEVKNERFLTSTRKKQCAILRHILPLTKRLGLKETDFFYKI